MTPNSLTALAEDPQNRELKPLGSGHYAAGWYPSKTAPVILPAELIPSGRHDPLPKGLQRRPTGLREVVLSAQAAERLRAAKGALIQASLSRQYQARHERVRLDFRSSMSRTNAPLRAPRCSRRSRCSWRPRRFATVGRCPRSVADPYA